MKWVREFIWLSRLFSQGLCSTKDKSNQAQQKRHQAQQKRHQAHQKRHQAQQKRHQAQQRRHQAQQKRHQAQQKKTPNKKTNKKTNKKDKDKKENTTDKNQDLQKAEQLFERWKIELWETIKSIVRGREWGGKGEERIGWLSVHGAETGIWLKRNVTDIQE